MKKLCMILAVLMLLLAGCSETPAVPDGPCQTHTDNNNDGLCDLCKEVVLVSFDIYAINDLHGKLTDGENHPGVDELSTYLRQAQTMSDNTIFLSSGDMWQGAPESNLTQGKIITEWMNGMGFASMTLGNHEFDWGEDAIRENAKLAEFPILAINIYSKETRQQVDYVQSSTVIDRDGVQIGIIGVMGDCYSSIATEQTTGIYFITGAELSALIRTEAEQLRSQGVDFIIMSIHDGYGQTTSGKTATDIHGRELSDYYDYGLSDGVVDLVFEAHTHQRYMLKDHNGVYHLQGGGDNKGISYVSVLINKANGNSEVLRTELIPTGDYALLEGDSIVSDLMEKYADQVAAATRIVGTNAEYRNKDQIRQLVAELYCNAGVERWGQKYDIVLGGGFISCRDPGYMPAGEINYGLLQSLLPFDNQLTLCSIKGRDLLSKFIETDHYSYFIHYTLYGHSIRDNVDPDATYYVITDSFSAYYAPNKMTVIETYDEDVFARDLLADYMGEGGLA